MDILFFWKDKSGRGFSNQITLDTISGIENETNWDGEDLKEWAENAEIGDGWENATDKYTRIK
jgi:hypothetical protein